MQGRGGRFPGIIATAFRLKQFVAIVLLTLALALLAPFAAGGQKFSVASFNLENYTDGVGGARTPKSAASRAKVRESIRALGADVLGLQEIGGAEALAELRSALKSGGLDYPYFEHVGGWDTNIQVAVLSRFPIIARRSHTQDSFLLNGRRFRLTRGIAELDLRVTTNYSFTLMVAHLKSRRPAAEADESDIREQEALVVREKIEARLRSAPDSHLIVVGDLNDVKDARSTRAIVGKGKYGLVDIRPAERNGDSASAGSNRGTIRNITWTHFYAKEDTYSRLDYILASHAMARLLDASGTYVLALPDWGLASDHRPVLAGFVTPER